MSARPNAAAPVARERRAAAGSVRLARFEREHLVVDCLIRVASVAKGRGRGSGAGAFLQRGARLTTRPSLHPRSLNAATRSTTASIRRSAPASARKIRCKALKRLNPRPGSRPMRPRSLNAATLSATASVRRSASASARKIQRKALKTLNPRPGSQPMRPRSLSGATLSTIASVRRSAPAAARKIRRKPLKRLILRPGRSGSPGRRPAPDAPRQSGRRSRLSRS